MECCDFKEKVWKCLTKVVFEQRLKSSDRVGHGVTERGTWNAAFNILSCEGKSKLLNTIYNIYINILYKPVC